VRNIQLIMSPAVANSVHNLLTEKIKEYEAYFGKIPTDESQEKRNICELKVPMIWRV
jgi:hypothetical protein